MLQKKYAKYLKKYNNYLKTLKGGALKYGFVDSNGKYYIFTDEDQFIINEKQRGGVFLIVSLKITVDIFNLDTSTPTIHITMYDNGKIESQKYAIIQFNDTIPATLITKEELEKLSTLPLPLAASSRDPLPLAASSRDPPPLAAVAKPTIWKCPYCTYNNNKSNKICEACHAWKCPLCTYINKTEHVKCDTCGSMRS